MATTLGVQDLSQLREDYGKEQADVIMNIIGNFISGQVTGDTAKQLSERFGKIMQDRESVSINSSDTSISRSKQLELAIPVSAIASLSAGEFVGMVADNPTEKIELKTFCCEVINNRNALQEEARQYKQLPITSDVSKDRIIENYLKIKKDISFIIEAEMERILNTPELENLIVTR